MNKKIIPIVDPKLLVHEEYPDPLQIQIPKEIFLSEENMQNFTIDINIKEQIEQYLQENQIQHKQEQVQSRLSEQPGLISIINELIRHTAVK